MANPKTVSTMVVLALVAFIASASVFKVEEWQRAILFRLGEIVETDFEPGLHFKMPFINNVRKFDGRILTLDSESERYLTAEKKNVIVDSFVKWRIIDTTAYYTSMGGDVNRANLRLSQIIKDGLRGEFGKRTIKEVVSGEREEIMAILVANTDEQAKGFGIEVTDVRIKRIDLADDVSSSVYRRMEAERTRVAKDLRSRGEEAAERIRSAAERQRTEIISDAYRDAEKIRGEGDALASEIYAKAYNRNPEFFSFYRSLEAYQSSFRDQGDVLVLEPDSDFFKYFSSSKVRK